MKDVIERLDKVMKSCAYLEISKELGVNESTPYLWRRRGKIPTKNIKPLIEFLEKHSTDCINIVSDLLEYLDKDKKERELKIEAARAEKRKYSLDRYYKNKGLEKTNS